MKENQCLVISLPLQLADLPIRIIRSSCCNELVCNLEPEDNNVHYSNDASPKYLFVWRQNDYIKLTMDEIVRVEANGSYSTLHLTGNRTIVISFNLAVVERELPPSDFMRIHRSHIVNLKHVIYLTGNSLSIGGTHLTIGREYRETFLERFIFLGVRRRAKQHSF